MGFEKNKFWYESQTEEELAINLSETIKEIDNRQAYRKLENLQNFKLYGNSEFLELDYFSYQNTYTRNRLKMNIVQQIIDTLTSKIAKNRPKMTFLTDLGDWEMQQKAKLLDKFMLGEFERCKVYEHSKSAFRFNCVFGTGAVKVYQKDKKVAVENVFIDNLLVDDREAMYGNPPNIYQVKLCNKRKLAALFPEHEEKIMKAEQDLANYYQNNSAFSLENIVVYEGWHLPSRLGATDGRHSLTLSNCTLHDEVWKRQRHPFAKMIYQDKLLGWYGRGICELLFAIQLELNKTLDRTQRALHLNSVPHILYEFGSKIVKAHFNNEIGGMIGYQGTPPTWITPSSVNPELFEWIQFMINKCFDEIGLSELSASSQKPQGLDSGAAIREYNDIETERFSELGQRWESFHIDIANLIIDEVKDLAGKNGKYEAMAKVEGGLEKIDWKQVNMKDDAYLMQIYPTSLLPQRPEGRLAKIQEMAQAGLLDKQESLSLLEFPDIKSITKFNNAPLDDIMAVIEEFTSNGEYLPPEPSQNLDLGIKMMNNAYLHYRHQNLPQERLSLFTRWVNDAISLLTPPPALENPELSAAAGMTEQEGLLQDMNEQIIPQLEAQEGPIEEELEQSLTPPL